MSDNVVRLRTFRKAKSRAEAEKRAEENRVKFGRSKAEKNATRAEKERADTAHDAGRIEKPES
jgi:hypothetical protein